MPTLSEKVTEVYSCVSQLSQQTPLLYSFRSKQLKDVAFPWVSSARVKQEMHRTPFLVQSNFTPVEQ